MVAVACQVETPREKFAAELAGAAYPVVLEHGVKGPWVDVELDLWRAIQGVLRQELRPSMGPDAAVETCMAREEVLAAVSDAAYRAALRHGISGPFLELELHLWHAIGKVIPRV
jgi:hypothetical protein